MKHKKKKERTSGTQLSKLLFYYLSDHCGRSIPKIPKIPKIPGSHIVAYPYFPCSPQPNITSAHLISFVDCRMADNNNDGDFQFHLYIHMCLQFPSKSMMRESDGDGE